MYKITSHPILDIPEKDIVEFSFDGVTLKAVKGQTIAAALHQAGFPVHQHSLRERKRTMECGIGKCGACEMLVDGRVRRICITKVDGVKDVRRIGKSFPNGEIFDKTDSSVFSSDEGKKIYRTSVAIIGAGPAGLSVRDTLRKAGVDNIVIDNNDTVGGQFLMQTHQFFFFEKERHFGGMRGFDIASSLAGKSEEGILLNSVVWDILEGKRLAVKNIETQEVFYVDASALVVATGALPFMPSFKNDDIPGVYTAAVFQKMMNRQMTLLGRNVLTVGAGNIGYLTSYQAMQAGAHIKAIIEGMPNEGGFPVQANRVRRLAIPILTSHVLLEAVPNDTGTGVKGAVIAKCDNFKPIPGTERLIEGIDCINICTGLLPDNQLFRKGTEVFGRACYSAGDSARIGEGTSAVLRGRQCAFEVMMDMGVRVDYQRYLEISKEYIDSQQRPVRVLEKPRTPSARRMASSKGFVVADCLYGFACNPCSFACPQGAITKSSTSVTPVIDYDKCIGCMACVSQCPGLAIFGCIPDKKQLYFPVEYKVEAGTEVFLVDNAGAEVGEGVIERVIKKSNRTDVAVVNVRKIDDMLSARGFIVKSDYPEPLVLEPVASVNTSAGATVNESANAPAGATVNASVNASTNASSGTSGDASTKISSRASDTYICHCEDVSLADLLKLLEGRKSITADELKHISRLGMGPCRGSRCLPRAKQALKPYGIEVTGDFTPRGPMANLVEIAGVRNVKKEESIITSASFTESRIEEVGAFVAGGGMAGSAVFRYLAEAGLKPVLINYDRGSSWRCIAGGRPAFSVPALADIANGNLRIFKELQAECNIDFKMTRYVSFVHDEQSYRDLDASRAWSDAYMVEKKDFRREISPYFNPDLDIYPYALVSNDCWQATPGKTIELVRSKGIARGGIVFENTELISVRKSGSKYHIVVKRPDGKYAEYRTDVFVNALGASADKFARMVGLETDLYPVRHQAFITKRMPLIGKEGDSLDMLIDRRHYKGFSAVYGQQLASTGQIIGCASPALDSTDAGKNLKVNTQEFLEIVSEVFTDWIPRLGGMSFQATWCGYYTEPRYIVDPSAGLFVGMRGHGFMLSQYIGKMYVDCLSGKSVPDYFKELSLGGNGLSENAFK